MSEFSVKTTREEVRRLFALAVPVAGAQLGGMMLGVTDMVMLGRVGASEMAAATLGNVIMMGMTIPLMGLLMGADPLFSQAHGAGNSRRIGRVLQGTLLLLPLVSLPLFVIGFYAPQLLRVFGQPEHLIALAKTYIWINLPSLPLFLGFSVLRQWLQARGIVKPAMWVMLGVNLLNVFANWVLIFGNLGAPALGLEGSAIATLITRSAMVLMLVAWIRHRNLAGDTWLPWDREAFRWKHQTTVLKLGWGIAISFAVEMWAFQAVALMAGQLGENALAAHSLVMHTVSLVFMVPLGLSIGCSVRVGNLIGAGDPNGAQRTAFVALGLTAIFMTIVSITFVALRNQLPLMFSSEPELVAIAATLLPIAAMFQVFDGLQGVCGGILRGMGRTRAPAFAHALGLYALGLPLGRYLLHQGEPHLTDIWWGLCSGLFVVATLLVGWVFVRGPRTVTALESSSA
jgi:MATE family multidrug resistance protein